MKRIVVTPAGRRRYLELLYRHLAAQKTDFDEWHVWLNTTDAADAKYIRSLGEDASWIRIIEHAASDPSRGIYNIHVFFEFACDPNALYLRVDDDVVWLEADFVRRMFDFRASTDYFLVYANIVNNAVVSYVQQRFGNVTYPSLIGYECMDAVGWKDPACAEAIHRAFMAAEAAGSLGEWKFPRWILSRHERVSINCISWRGADFKRFGGRVGRDEEQWLSVDKPRSDGLVNCIYGGAMCVHFSFHTQRARLDATDLLDRYTELAPKPDFEPPEKCPKNK